MAVVVGDKLSGTMMLVLPDKTFFHADCQMTVTGVGENYGTSEQSEASGATGATGATGTAATHGAAHHESKK